MEKIVFFWNCFAGVLVVLATLFTLLIKFEYMPHVLVNMALGTQVMLLLYFATLSILKLIKKHRDKYIYISLPILLGLYFGGITELIDSHTFYTVFLLWVVVYLSLVLVGFFIVLIGYTAKTLLKA